MTRPVLVSVKKITQLKIKMSLLVLSVGALAGCGSSTGDPIDIPDVDMSCNTARCRVNSSSYAVSIITTEGCASDQIDSNSIAAGTTTVTCNSSTGCTGSVTSWRDKNGASIAQISASTYYVCNWIDLNDDRVKNDGVDEFSELREAITTASNIEANGPTWGVSYASRGSENE